MTLLEEHPTRTGGEPIAARRPGQFVAGREDEYAWLADRDDPNVLAHLQAETDWAGQTLEKLERQIELLADEYAERLDMERVDVPERSGEFEYFERVGEDEEYGSYWRRRVRDEKPSLAIELGDELVYDAEAMARGHDYFAVGDVAVSRDHRYVAVGVDTNGDEIYDIVVLEITTGREIQRIGQAAEGGLAFSTDGNGLLFVRADRKGRCSQVVEHRFGTGERLVFDEADEAYWVELTEIGDRSHARILSESSDVSECWVVALKPGGAPRCIVSRDTGVQADIEYHDGLDTFFVITDADDKRDGQVLAVPGDTDDTHLNDGQVLVAERSGRKLKEVRAYADHLVVASELEGIIKLEAIAVADVREGIVEMTELCPGEELADVELLDGDGYWSRCARVSISSIARPERIVDIDLTDGTTVVRSEQEAWGWDGDRIVVERRYATAGDGTLIPVTVAYDEDVVMDGTNPTLVYAYGAYGDSTSVGFESDLAGLIARGVVYVAAHVRGGGEGGRAWHDAARLEKKGRTFSDFLDVVEALIDWKVTEPGRVVARGGSAGGLVMGAIANARPDLFAGVVANVPFVDPIGTMSDPDLPLVVTEWDEWGNPADERIREAMEQYAPYDNVRAQGYPALYVTAGFNDPRVCYWEAAKWVARIRATRTNREPVVLRVDFGSGHFGRSARYEQFRSDAERDAFILWVLGRTDRIALAR